jgi:hypothetical protein
VRSSFLLVFAYRKSAEIAIAGSTDGFNADRRGPRSLFYPAAMHIKNVYSFRDMGRSEHCGLAERNLGISIFGGRL